MKDALTFDDVCLVPQYNNVASRVAKSGKHKIDLSAYLFSHGRYKIDVPILAANMDTVIGPELARKLIQWGTVPIFHRFTDFETKLAWAKEFGDRMILSIGATNGEITGDLSDAYRILLDEGIELGGLCIDVAHSHCESVKNTLLTVKRDFPQLPAIVGNVCTAAATQDVINWGADAVKVGVGPGCLATGTPVLMADGSYKAIESIVPGEKVINKNGKAVEVKSKVDKGYREVVKLELQAYPEPIYVTPDHEFFMFDCSHFPIQDHRGNRGRGISKLLDTQPRDFLGQTKKWKPISEASLIDSYCLSPKAIGLDLQGQGLKDCGLIPSHSLGYLLGLYLGDGSLRCYTSKVTGKVSSGEVCWYCNVEDTAVLTRLEESVQQVFSCKLNKFMNRKTCIKATISLKNSALLNMFQSLGKYDRKFLPSSLLSSDETYLTGIFEGLIDSDGHIRKDNGRVDFANTSLDLINLFCLVSRLLGHTYTCLVQNEPGQGTTTLSTLNVKSCKKLYRVNIHLSNRVGKEYWASGIKSMENVKLKMQVWDIEVDCPTQSFIAGNVIVHNSACTTRMKTGFGVSQFTAIQECSQIAKKFKTPIIADGGIRGPADIVKALAAGASCAMMGKMFALTQESAAEKVEFTLDGKPYTESEGKVVSGNQVFDLIVNPQVPTQFKAKYRGQASKDFQEEFKGGLKEGTVAEGEAFWAPVTGSVDDLLNELTGSLRSAFTYAGAKHLGEFQDKVEVRRVYPTYLAESNIRK